MTAQIHLFFAIIFAGFIITDRVFLRRAFDQQSLLNLYKKSKNTLILITLIIIISGAFLLNNSSYYYIKASFGVLTVVLFFACPYFASKLTAKGRAVYRFLVLLLLVVTILLAKNKALF